MKPSRKPKSGSSSQTLLGFAKPQSTSSTSQSTNSAVSRSAAKSSPTLFQKRPGPKQLSLQSGFLVLHPNFNITGSDTLRWSSTNPNQQNVSKQEEWNLRQVYRPLPGREWYSGDYSNIELRIFAYACGDQQLIAAFEEGYSVHAIIFEVLWPNEFATARTEAIKLLSAADRKDPKKVRNATGDIIKVKYKSNLYQWIKNGNFALIYGAGITKADRTYHQKGAYDKIRTRLPLIDSFMRLKNREALENGFVRALGCGHKLVRERQPDGTYEIGRDYGYKLYVSADEPHKAVNYFVQPSAGWAISLAIRRVWEYLKQFNQTRLAQLIGLPTPSMFGHYMTMQVHDELDFDFPVCNRTPSSPDAMNLMIIKEIKRIMESSGDDLGLPTPVEFARHTESWAKEEKVRV